MLFQHSPVDRRQESFNQGAINTADAPNPSGPPAGLKLLAVWFAIRFFWDTWILYHTFGTAQFSVPKAGIAVVLLPLAFVLPRQELWAVCMSGVVCLFWLGFAVARTIGHVMPGADPAGPYPWANWVALPALLYLLHYAQRFQASPTAPPAPPSDCGG